MILPSEKLLDKLDIPDGGRNHILKFFLVPVRKIISVQKIYSDSLIEKLFCQNIKKHEKNIMT